jgi:glycosyltransferase involved in cell wall biosynthesis
MSSRASTPAISVVMPVHNACPYLDEAIESILGQTFRDFEFVIYDDASTDGSSEKLVAWSKRDSRITLFRGDHNSGPAASANRVIGKASAPLIARMDADDISLPERLERQARMLDENPDFGIVASLCDVIDSAGRRIRGPELWRLARRSWFTPFPHGSMTMRREVFDRTGGYRGECEFWEDLDFVIRASQHARILVLPRPLYRYRQSTSSSRIASNQDLVEEALDLRYRSIGLIQQGQSYDELLRTPGALDDRRVDPRVFVSLGLLALWSNQRPKFVRRFLKRARLRFDGSTLVALIWIAWARVSPGTIGFTLKMLSRARNAAVRPRPGADVPLEWRPPWE